MNFSQKINDYLTAGIDTGENLLLKRNIIITVALCTLTLLLEVVVIIQVLFGILPFDQIPKVLISTLGVFIPLYLLIAKKNPYFAITFFVACNLILELGMLIVYFDDGPYTHLMWAHVLTFLAVLLLGFKRSIVPMLLYSFALGIVAYMGIDDGVGSHWRTMDFHQFVMLQICVLSFAFISEWTIERMLQKLQQTQKQERASAQAHTEFMENMLDNKKQLLIDISHELRTPLTVLKADLEAMEDGINTQEESYPVLHRKLEQIDNLIEDIYLISQSDSEQLSLYVETISLSELGKELEHSFLPLTKTKDLKLIMDQLLTSDCTIKGDWQRLLRVFGNLLQNSIHYTNRGGQIEVRFQTVTTGVEIAVHDSAPGVPEQEQKMLFERFYRRESSRSRATGGSGLGLAICKAIVEAHDGTMSIASSPLGGLAITSFLPFK